jgi:hypothetical protein
MWEPWHLTTLCASTACYRDSFTFLSVYLLLVYLTMLSGCISLERLHWGFHCELLGEAAVTECTRSSWVHAYFWCLIHASVMPVESPMESIITCHISFHTFISLPLFSHIPSKSLLYVHPLVIPLPYLHYNSSGSYFFKTCLDYTANFYSPYFFGMDLSIVNFVSHHFCIFFLWHWNSQPNYKTSDKFCSA